MAIDEGDKIIFHALKVDDFLTLGIFHSHAFETGVQCTITCWMFILGELWTVNCSDKGCSAQEYCEFDNADWYHVVIVWRS